MSDFVSPPVEDASAPAPQIVPQSREAEEAVIGAVLINPETYYDVAQFLKAEDFYIHRHRWIWEAFTRLHERRIPIDFLTVSEELSQQGQLGEIGGPAYLTSLVNNVPTSLHAEAYGHLVEETAVRRRMLEAANQIAKLAYQEEAGIDTVMDDAEKAIFGISERRMTRDLQTIQQVLSEYYDRIDQLSRRDEEIFGVPTGFIDLDRLLGGLQSSDLLIIAGRPGTGKTAFMLSLAKNAAQTYKKNVAIFSLEMSNEQLVQRLISQETGIDSHRLRTGKLTEDEWPVFTHAIEVLSDTHIFLDDTPGLTPLQLRTKCRRLHMEFGLDLVVLDYLQLMSSGARSENRVQEVSYISRNMKILARELNVPVLAAAQLSRAIEQRTDKEPQLSDLRESGCLTGETLVSLADGTFKPIASLVGTQPEVVTLNELRVSNAQASRVWLTGHRPVFRLITRSGRSIRATANHPFRKLDGWHSLEELQPGDRIAIPRVYPEPENCTAWTEEKIILLAHLIGDGCYVSRQPLHYTSASPYNLEVVAQAAGAAFGIQSRYVAQQNWYHLYLSAGANKWHPNPVRIWLRNLGIDGQRSYEKVIPDEIFLLPSAQIALFLKHLWATDGSIYIRKTTHGQAGTIYYSTTSHTLALQVQQLLTRLGIFSRIKQVGKKGYRPGYVVHIYGRQDQMRFAEVIGGFGERKEALNKVVELISSVKANTNIDTIPMEIWGSVKERMKERGITQRGMAQLRGTVYGGQGHFSFAPSRQVLGSYAAILEDENLDMLASSDIFWDTVTAIEPDGEEDVYDMTVPSTHNFIANGIVVHNSLEQDADIVMFIHRPEMYEKDTLKQNIAQIKVSKHRNGPVGTVELIFRSQLAKFENAATHHVDLSQVG